MPKNSPPNPNPNPNPKIKSNMQVKFLNTLNDALKTIASMPVAISMLCLVALSSVIGTILQQQQNYVDYVNRFGSWWTDIFINLSLNQIYSSTWFLLILAFLCISTSICIIRSWPPFYRQIKKYQLDIKKNFLLQQKFSTTLEIESSEKLLAKLKKLGYQIRIKKYSDETQPKTKQESKQEIQIIAAKKNAYQKWGYLLTHIAVLVISIGGLFDGNLPLKWRLWTGENQTLKTFENTWQKKHIIDESNPSFRANLWVAEGDASNFATIRLTDGMLGQRLPFKVQLEKFYIDYYSTGMPKSFISDVVLTSNDGKQQQKTRLEVNKPAEFMGYRLYQSSFEDGGSRLDLQPVFWQNTNNDFKINQNAVPENIKFSTTTQDKPNLSWINSNLNSNSDIKNPAQKLQLEISEFKAINVHRNALINNANQPKQTNQVNQSEKNNQINDVLKNALTSHIDQKEFKNIGPSLQYKLRGENQKAIEYHNYMLPIEVEGHPSFIIGMREKNSENFQYVYIPSFEGKSFEWQMLAQAFFNEQKRNAAIASYAKKYPQISDSITASLKKSSSAFITAQQEKQPGLMGLALMAQSAQAQQPNIGPILLRMFQDLIWEIWQQTRTERGFPALEKTPQNTLFAQKAVIALSDIPLIQSPVWFELQNFEQKNASVLQITRSPGQFWVYLGCVMLVVGVFMMLFLQELRLWIYLEDIENIEDVEDLKDSKTKCIIAMARARHIHAQSQAFEKLISELKNQ